MKLHAKLNQAREQFHATKLTKTGHNKFANYKYFELGDFIIPALKVFKDVGLCAVVSFGKDEANMTIVDTDTGESMVITSPMSTAALKGCHEVQNLGAVQTYLRRYLWVAALEIVEHDAIDSSAGIEKKPNFKQSGFDTAKEEYDALTPDRRSLIDRVAGAVIDLFNGDDLVGAYGEYIGITDNEERAALYLLLPTNIRKALAAHDKKLKLG